MAFDRKEYGMNSGIPFIKIADPVEVTIKDRKSTRLNSSHGYISYAVFCLKKKVPDLTLRISDDLGESSVHLKNLLRGGRLTDRRTDQRGAEAHPVVGDVDQVPINSVLERFKAGSTGTRDLVRRRSAV